jgi:hypothetical protein
LEHRNIRWKSTDHDIPLYPNIVLSTLFPRIEDFVLWCLFRIKWLCMFRRTHFVLFFAYNLKSCSSELIQFIQVSKDSGIKNTILLFINYYIGKVKFPLYLTKYHAMKTCPVPN